MTDFIFFQFNVKMDGANPEMDEQINIVRVEN